MKFRKKPVVIEAVQWDGTQNAIEELGTLTGNVGFYPSLNRSIIIPILEGDMTASLGDWIIKGIKNEFYPCKPDIFAQTYEPV
jgi:hypothetical protein